MPLLQELWKKIKGEEVEEEEMDDNITKDRYLRSLRREDRTLDEAEEKEYLKKKIALRRKAKLRKHLWGIKEKIREKKQEQSFLGKYKL